MKPGASRMLAIWVPLLITAGVGYFAFGDQIRAWRGAATTSVEPSAAQYVALRGCRCTDPDTQLEISVDEVGSKTNPKFDLQYRVRAANRYQELASTKRSSPPRRWKRRNLGIGVACTAGAMIIAADRSVTSWSTADGSPMWTTKLPRRYRYEGKAAESGISAYCGQMAISSGGVRVPTGKQGDTFVDLKNGKIRKR